MARQKMTCKMYLTIDGKKVLWYEVDEDGNVTWYLPKEITEPIKQKMLDNISKCISNNFM